MIPKQPSGLLPEFDPFVPCLETPSVLQVWRELDFCNLFARTCLAVLGQVEGRLDTLNAPALPPVRLIGLIGSGRTGIGCFVLFSFLLWFLVVLRAFSKISRPASAIFADGRMIPASARTVFPSASVIGAAGRTGSPCARMTGASAATILAGARMILAVASTVGAAAGKISAIISMH